MKYIISYSIILLLGAVLFFGCAETKYDLTEPQQVAIHSEGILKPASDNFHGQLARGLNWDLAECARCHGNDYAGGTVGVTCLTCHSNENGPEACNTCHGDFDDATSIAPPQGTNNETNTADAAVGAHQLHVSELGISCSQCHTVPAEFSSEGHIDETERAELVFGDLADNGPTAASYDFTNFTCQNNYCHGNFEFLVADTEYDFAYEGDKIFGNNFSPVWNMVDGTQAACGTCHGSIDSTGVLLTALPNGHYGQEDFDINDCFNCHGNVVNQAGEIIDPTLHANGEKNVFGN